MSKLDSTFDPAIAQSVAGDAGAFMQQLDLVQRRALIVRITEAELRTASFLDERLGMQGRVGFWMPLEGIAAAASSVSQAQPSADFIFHIGHCGSTLLSRLLDQSSNVLGLREPLPLRELSENMRDLESPLSRLNRAQWEGVLAASLTLLGRRFTEQQRIIIKATSTCNGLVDPVLGLYPESRAVLLYIRLEPYLATMAKGVAGGLDALHAAPARLQFLHDFLDDRSIRLPDLETPEIVAMNWVAELARFEHLSRTSPARERLLMLDFEQLLADIPGVLGDVCRHLDIPEADSDSTQDPHTSVLAAYAKSPTHVYSATDREHDLNLSRRKFPVQIERGLRWAEQIMQKYEQLAALRPLVR
jgi:hypothetical protein